MTPPDEKSAYTLYWWPDSANLIVRLALEELGVPYRARRADRGPADELHSAGFLALNPQGLLPVLIDPEQDAPLFETGAILLHLADKHRGLLPPEPAARGRCLKWLFFLSNTLHADLRLLFHSERYVVDAGAIPTLQAATCARVAQHFALLDEAIGRAGGLWLLGDTLTVCDLYLAICARWAALYVGGDAIAALPHLQRLLQAVEQRPAIRRACDQEGIFGRPFTAPAAAA